MSQYQFRHINIVAYNYTSYIGSPNIVSTRSSTTNNVDSTQRPTNDKGKSIAHTTEPDFAEDVSEDEHGYIERISGISKGLIFIK